MLAMVDLTFQDFAFAGATSSIFAAIGKLNALTECGFQDSFILGNSKLFAARFERDLVRHSHSFQ